MIERLPFIPYPPIERHGVIGDRRTAGLVAADGTLDWLCLPDYDGASLFGALLDAKQGGFWRFGPAVPSLGQQHYLEESAALVTTWSTRDYALELTDVMAWPEDERPKAVEDQRVVIRQLRCTRGEAACGLIMQPRSNFKRAASVIEVEGGRQLRVGSHRLGIWATQPLQPDPVGTHAFFRLHAGEEVWTVMTYGGAPADWNQEQARRIMRQSMNYWINCLGNLSYRGPRQEQVRRSALLLHLLSYAPDGSLVAAPTTSLPERIGGDRNYDYRFAWVRDASLSLAVLSLLGDTETATRYLDWLCSLGSLTDAPFQVMYGLSGGLDLEEHEQREACGYRGSAPVHEGNRAYQQIQHGALGYLADCAELHQATGGSWNDRYWEKLIKPIADYTLHAWREPDSGIWELPKRAHFVSSKVMDWVTLDRAVKIARRTGHDQETAQWEQTMHLIQDEVMERGWSERLGSFRQHYDGESLDASTLLIPITGFLPADHPRVLSMVRRMEDSLAIDHFVYRFHPDETPGYSGAAPLGEFEGAFLPCTFWLATTYAMQGRVADADAVLTQAEQIAGDLLLFAEEVDPRTGSFLGNTPLLFSQMEYVRAIVALSQAQNQGHE